MVTPQTDMASEEIQAELLQKRADTAMKQFLSDTYKAIQEHAQDTPEARERACKTVYITLETELASIQTSLQELINTATRNEDIKKIEAVRKALNG